MGVQASKPAASGFRRTQVAFRRQVVAQSFFLANEEPDLNELMADPMTRRLMASDGITSDVMMHVITQAQERLRA